MSTIHHKLLEQMFTIQLAKDFSIESRRSPSQTRYCLYKNGMEMSDWLSEDEMECALQTAIETRGREIIEQILGRTS